MASQQTFFTPGFGSGQNYQSGLVPQQTQTDTSQAHSETTGVLWDALTSPSFPSPGFMDGHKAVRLEELTTETKEVAARVRDQGDVLAEVKKDIEMHKAKNKQLEDRLAELAKCLRIYARYMFGIERGVACLADKRLESGDLKPDEEMDITFFLNQCEEFRTYALPKDMEQLHQN